MIALLAGLAAASEVVTVSWGFTNVHAVVGDEGVILVDTHYPRKGDRILKRLEKAGVEPDDIRAIVVTHAHADHAGSATELSDALDVPILAGQLDRDALHDGRFSRGRVTGLLGALIYPTAARGYPEVEPDVFVTATRSLAAWGVDGDIVPVGGHTPGSLAVVLDDAALVGDLVRGRLFAHKRPTKHFLHHDRAAAEAALGTLLDGIDTVYPGHGGPLEADRVRGWLR